MAQVPEKAVVVTGASTGIGWGTTKVLLDAGHFVFGSVRKRADVNRLIAEFGRERFLPLIFDVTDRRAIASATKTVASRLGKGRLAGLVNNAGVAVSGPLAHLDMAEVRRQFEINVFGQLMVTQAFLPLLGMDRTRTGQPGRIINMSSVGGKQSFPFVGAYTGSKHALEGMSEALRRELMLFGIDVIVIGPGTVTTPIWTKAEQVKLTPFEKTEYAPILAKFQKVMLARARAEGLPPERVGRVVLKALNASRPKVRYAVVPNRFTNWTLPQLLPKRWLDRIIGRMLGLRAR